MNVRAFTADETSSLDQDQRGSYLGLIEKVLSYSTSLFSLLPTTKHFICLLKFGLSFLIAVPQVTPRVNFPNT